jgi:hypothetical protein
MIGQDFAHSKSWFGSRSPLFGGAKPPHMKGLGSSISVHERVHAHHPTSVTTTGEMLSQNKVFVKCRAVGGL